MGRKKKGAFIFRAYLSPPKSSGTISGGGKVAGTGATAAAPASAPSQLNPVTDGRLVTLTLLAPFENGFDADAPAAACGAPPEEKGLDAEAGGGAENGFAVLNGLFAMTNQRGKERGRGERGGCREGGARDWWAYRVVVLGVRCWKETGCRYILFYHLLNCLPVIFFTNFI